jgi:hypothetical protein
VAEQGTDWLKVLEWCERNAKTCALVDPLKLTVDDARGGVAWWDKAKRAWIDPPAVTVVRKPLRARALSLTALAELYAFARARAAVSAEHKGLVVVGEDVVTARPLPDDDACEMRLHLDCTPTWLALVELAESDEEDGKDGAPKAGREFTQRELVDWLAERIDGVVTPGNLRDALRTVKFSAGQQGEATVGQGKYAASLSTVADMTGAADIPENVTVDTVVYRNVPGLPPAKVQLRLVVLADRQRFRLVPMAGQIEQHQDAAQAAIVAQLRGSIGEAAGVYAADIGCK